MTRKHTTRTEQASKQKYRHIHKKKTHNNREARKQEYHHVYKNKTRNKIRAGKQTRKRVVVLMAVWVTVIAAAVHWVGAYRFQDGRPYRSTKQCYGAPIGDKNMTQTNDALVHMQLQERLFMI